MAAREHGPAIRARSTERLAEVRAAAQPAPRATGLSLLGLLNTIAALVIVLGLMVLTVRHVRLRSGEELTQQILGELEEMLARHPELEKALAGVPPLVREGRQDSRALLAAATENNMATVRIIRRLVPPPVFAQLPLSVYDGQTLRDAWGTPLVYMARGAPNIGIAPQQRAFFLSAGPDRDFATLLDNLYSYERPRAR